MMACGPHHDASSHCYDGGFLMLVSYASLMDQTHTWTHVGSENEPWGPPIQEAAA